MGEGKMKKLIYLLVLVIMVSGCATTRVNLVTLSNSQLTDYYYKTLSELEYHQGQIRPPSSYQTHHRGTYGGGSYGGYSTTQSHESPGTSFMRGYNRGRANVLNQQLIAIRHEMYRRGMTPPY